MITGYDSDNPRDSELRYAEAVAAVQAALSFDVSPAEASQMVAVRAERMGAVGPLQVWLPDGSYLLLGPRSWSLEKPGV